MQSQVKQGKQSPISNFTNSTRHNLVYSKHTSKRLDFAKSKSKRQKKNRNILKWASPYHWKQQIKALMFQLIQVRTLLESQKTPQINFQTQKSSVFLLFLVQTQSLKDLVYSKYHPLSKLWVSFYFLFLPPSKLWTVCFWKKDIGFLKFQKKIEFFEFQLFFF